MSDGRGTGMAARLVAPAAVRRLVAEEVTWPLQVGATPDGRPYRTLAAVVEDGDAPICYVVVPVDERGLVEESVLRAALAESPCITTPPAHPRPDPRPRHPVSVVVSTCGDPLSVVRCVSSFLADDEADIEVIVVENRPAGSTTRAALSECFQDDPRIQVVDEPRRGSSHARNRGLGEAGGELVAFLDGDVVCGPSWLETIRAAVGADPEIGMVAGPILPLTLDSATQVALERFASDGKGFERATFTLRNRPEDPLFPHGLAAFGSGATIALRSDTAARLGGFDPVLGAGSPCRGGEDLDLVLRALQLGLTIAYEPGVVVWHDHPAGWAPLHRQAFGSGTGLGATLAKHLLEGTDRRGLLRRVPGGIAHLVDPGSRRNAGKGAGYPRRLDVLQRAGMAFGPFAFVWSRLVGAGRATR